MTASLRTRALVIAAAAGAVGLLPFIVPRSVVGTANVGAAFALVAISLVLLTGWVGQISLGHAALVGVGAYATGYMAAGAGIPFPLSLLPSAAIAGAMAALLGLVALRVRGLYLAVATLVFNWMASEFLFRQSWVTRYSQIPDRPLGGSGWLPRFEFTDRRTFYIVAWAVVAAAVLACANLRESKIGRAFFAVRGSEMGAASLGIDVMRTKLVAFACSGTLAGAAGNIFMSDNRVVTADSFTFTFSLFYLAVAVVGGLRSLMGAVAAALVFSGLREVFFRVPSLGGLLELVSGLLLAGTLLAYRGGLASLGPRLDGVVRRLGARVASARRSAGRREEPPAAPRPARRGGPAKALAFLRARLATTLVPRPAGRRVPAAGRRIDLAALLHGTPGHDAGEAAEASVPPTPPPSTNGSDGKRARIIHLRDRIEASTPVGPREARAAVIEAEAVVVRFGGLTAVDGASLAVREGEIVGLIGPNGAGKTTLFNAIAGFNSPAGGAIRIFGVDVTHMPVHERARLGVARTFQAIQLFSELTVFENLLVATHVDNPSTFVANLLATDASFQAERAARDRVRDVLNLLDLAALADRRIADLPFGILRMVEVARALVTGYPLMMLDEPASGLDNTETDRLMDVLRFVRSLGITELLIEHDVRMVTGISDYMYVLDQGRIIAEGTSEAIQRDPAVIAAYLGEPVAEVVG